MKMENQKKIWTSRYEKRALTVAFVHTCALTACADPGFFVKGDPGPMARNSLDYIFFLFWGSREVQMLISIEPHITCDFPGGSGPLSPLWICT